VHVDRLIGARRAGQEASHLQEQSKRPGPEWLKFGRSRTVSGAVLVDLTCRAHLNTLPISLSRFAILPGLTPIEKIAFRRGKCFAQHDVWTRSPHDPQGGISMLVLTRKTGESIIIDGCITVTVVAVQGNKVRIGISAPPDVTIDREEIHLRRQEFADVELVSVGGEG
jgi:carbon storage regulator